MLNFTMNATEIMSEALELPRNDRSYLASKLIESLDESEELTPEFQAELDARLARWKSGENQAVSSDELHREIEQMLSR